MDSHAPTELRLKLLDAGFAPIPLYGKAPPIYGKNNQRKGLAGWEKLQRVSTDEVTLWGKTWPDACNTGALTGAMPTFDADIKTPEAAEAIEGLARKRYEDRGLVLVRIGQPPKRAIPFRTNQPFAKVVANLIAPNGEKGQKIEMLCDGQQVVVAGIHPDTKEPYRWHGGMLGEVKWEELPEIGEAEARALVEDAAKLLIDEYGYKRVGEQTKGSGKNNGGHDWSDLFDNIRAGAELHDSICALAAKMISHGMERGAAEELIRDAVRQAPEPHDERWRERYDDISRAVRTAWKKFAAPLDEEEAPRPTAAHLPELNLDADPVAVARELAALIAKRRDILLNGHMPVRVMCEQGQDPRAIELSPDGVRTYAYEICRCVRTVKKKVVEVPLKPDIAKLYLNGLEGQWGLRPLRSISTSPLLSADGGIRSATGYDETTGLWCHGIPAVSVPPQPTKQDAEKTLLTLRQIFCTFPFADAAMIGDGARGVEVVDLREPPQLDESTHLVALMTSTCRACLSLAPGFLYDAPSLSGAGTGKGLLVKGACIIGHGAQPSAMTAGHDELELDKRLTASAIEARPAIYLDNFNGGTLESHTLASFLTEDPARVRVLGHSKTVPLHTRAFVAITGNNVQIAEDIARRILKISIDARMENPEQRSFAPGFLQSLFARRAELLSACLTIWRWGVSRGNQLPRGRSIGSYEDWARWCRDPLLALGCRDPIERISEIKAADPRRKQLIEVFTQWWNHHTNQIVTAAELHTEVKEAIDLDAKRRTNVDGNVELQHSRQKITWYLTNHVNTRAGGFHLKPALPNTTSSRPTAHYQLDRERA